MLPAKIGGRQQLNTKGGRSLDLIQGVQTKKLKVIPDERGRLMEILRRDEEIYRGFGQVYMTTAYPGVVKGWHYHKKQIDNIAILKGMVKLVLYDSRKESPTKGMINEFFLGKYNPLLVQVPAWVYHGFKNIEQEEALILNCPSEPYNYSSPDEYRLSPHDSIVPYKWDRRDG